MINNEPDNFEKCIRFGCGAIFGIVVGFINLWYWIDDLKVFYFIIIMVVSIALCGYLAAKYGDRFWESLKDYWWF